MLNDYQNFLNESLIPKMQTLSFQHRIFMQDNAPCHSEKSTIKFLKDKNIVILSSWQLQSPDINPIENVWKIIKDRIDLNLGENAVQMYLKIKNAWDSLNQYEIQNLILSVPNRINSVIAAKGGNTKY